MVRGFFKAKTGATAVEFAIVMPVALAIFMGVTAIGISLWYTNLLKSVATEAARCLAISGPPCTSDAPGCGDTPGNCYVIALARKRGFNALAHDNIAVDPAAAIGGVASTNVTLTYNYVLLGYTFSLTQQAGFPNL